MSSLTSSANRSLDWTRDATPPTGYCRFIRNYDFASTPLGPIETWSQLLRQNVCHIMTHMHPRVLAWGPDLNLVHNEPARDMAIRYGRANCLGRPMRSSWPELMDAGLGDKQREVMETGKTVQVPDMLLFLDHSPQKVADPDVSSVINPKIESHLNMCLVPVLDGDGQIVGILHEYFDISQAVLATRRIPVIITVDGNLASDPDQTNLWGSIMSPLNELREDIPFAIGYSIMPEFIGELPMRERLWYEDSIGIEGAHPLIAAMKQDDRIIGLLQGAWDADVPKYVPGVSPQERDESHDRRILYNARDVLSAAQPMQLRESSTVSEISPLHAASSSSTLEASDNRFIMREPLTVAGRGFDAPRQHFIVIAMPRSVPPDPFGVLILGLILGMNPMRPYDTEYRAFFNLLKSIIMNNITSLLFLTVVRRFKYQLECTEYQLQFTSSQLRSMEQQLQATSKQLQSTEDRLRSSEQRLQSSEQRLQSSEQRLQSLESTEQRLQSTEDRLRSAEQRVQSIEQENKALATFQDAWKAVTKHVPVGFALWRRIKSAAYIPKSTNPGWNKLLGINEGDTPPIDMCAEDQRNGLEQFRFKVHPEDQEIVQVHWKALREGTNLGKLQIRVLRDKPDDETKREFQWVLLQYTHFYQRIRNEHWLGAW